MNFVSSHQIFSVAMQQSHPTATAKDGRRPRNMAVVESKHNERKQYREIIKLLAEAEDQYESTKSNH